MEPVTQETENKRSTNDVSMDSSLSEPSPAHSFERKQWKREQKIDLIELFKNTQQRLWLPESLKVNMIEN